MTVELLFSTPVYHAVESESTVQKLSCEIETALPEVRKLAKSNPWECDLNTSFKYGGVVNDVVKFEMLAVRDTFVTHIVNYLNALGAVGNIDINMTSSWFNFSTRGQYQEAHDHPENDLCAVYYHKAPENCGSIKFHTPSVTNRSARLFSSVLKSLETSAYVNYKPEKGKILIFPSFLTHSVLPNCSDDERISLACNFQINPKG
jgi:uncharacterized protein (TIGR02466 family)